MRIALVTDGFSSGMGYMENRLPEALLKQGHQVSLISSRCSREGAPSMLQEGTPGDPEWVTRLRHVRTPAGVALVSLSSTLADFEPTVVQSLVPCSHLLFLQVQRACNAAGYMHVGQDHSSLSVFAPSRRGHAYLSLYRWIAAPWVNRGIAGIWIPSPEIMGIITREYGIAARLIHQQPLGVATEVFNVHIMGLQARESFRLRYGFASNDVVFIYTGKIVQNKGPLLLANAIVRLRDQGIRARGLFIGAGQESAIGTIRASPGCMHLPAQPANALAAFYQLADVAVWPREESLSILDAMACGLPVIVNDRIRAPERRRHPECLYQLDNLDSLVQVMRTLLDVPTRQRIGKDNAQFILKNLSWDLIARERVASYEKLARERE